MAGKKPQVLSTVVSIGGAISPTLGKSLKQAQGLISANLGKAGLAGILGAVGSMAVKAAKDFSAAYKTIRIGTGATGKALDGLMTDFQRTLAVTSADVGDVSKAIADYNTALGASGEELQSISKAALVVSDRFGEDIGSVVASSSKAMMAWSVEVKDGSRLLNFFRKVSQATGKSVTALQEETARFAPQLQGLGYSIESSAVLLGNLSKQGVRGEQMMMALNKITAVGADGWAAYYEQIHDARSEQEALAVASQLFGKETAPGMVKAIRSEAFAVGEMTEALKGDKETLDAFARDTEDIGDIVKQVANYLEVLFMPAVKAVMEYVRDALKWWTSSNGRAALQGVKDLVSGDLMAKAFGGGDVKATGFRGLPRKASGGFVGSPAICGEAGPEAVISFDPAFRAENLRYWQDAGRALGVGGGNTTSIDMSGMVFAPTISGGGAGAVDVLAQLRSQERDFADAICSALDSRLARAY